MMTPAHPMTEQHNLTWLRAIEAEQALERMTTIAHCLAVACTGLACALGIALMR